MTRPRDRTNADVFLSPSGTRYRRLGAHEVGAEDLGWFDRRKPVTRTWHDPKPRTYSPGKALAIFALAALLGRACLSTAVDATEAVQARVAAHDLGPIR